MRASCQYLRYVTIREELIFITCTVSSYLAAWSALSIPGLLAYKISQIPFMPSFGRTSHENNVHRLPDWNYDLHALEPIPLAVNGNSTNRVNLVYFGDGCKYLACGRFAAKFLYL